MKNIRFFFSISDLNKSSTKYLNEFYFMTLKRENAQKNITNSENDEIVLQIDTFVIWTIHCCWQASWFSHLLLIFTQNFVARNRRNHGAWNTKTSMRYAEQKMEQIVCCSIIPKISPRKNFKTFISVKVVHIPSDSIKNTLLTQSKTISIHYGNIVC